MRHIKAFGVSLLTLLIFYACKPTKSITDQLYNPTWELEYISGPRIAFEGLFPNKKPQITFNKETKRVVGNNGCNGYSANYTLYGDKLTFGEPGPTTMMYCGEGEQVFLKTMKQINKFRFSDDGKLILVMDDVDMMRFKKTE